MMEHICYVLIAISTAVVRPGVEVHEPLFTLSCAD